MSTILDETNLNISINDQFGYGKNIAKHLIDIDLDNFKTLWGTEINMFDFEKNEETTSLVRLLSLHVLFFEFSKLSELLGRTLKSKNIWYNEIRENALLNFFGIDRIDLESFMTDKMPPNIVSDIMNLYDNWTIVLIECANREYQLKQSGKSIPDVNPDGSTNLPFTIRSIEKKGGQKYPYDFELTIVDKSNKSEIPIKIEFKFSGKDKTSVKELAQFGASNTESVGAHIIFNRNSYLDFFWGPNVDQPTEGGFFDQMWKIVKTESEKTETNLILNFNREEWKTTAKSVSAPKSTSKTAQFHKYLRNNIINKNFDKKNIVNNSFNEFIRTNIENIRSRTRDISNMFNQKQQGKYFCIFSGGGFNIDTIDEFNITDVKISGINSFTLISGPRYHIKCGMSWGNGGAGNQNPRILFKLQDENEETDSVEVEDEDQEEDEGEGETTTATKSKGKRVTAAASLTAAAAPTGEVKTKNTRKKKTKIAEAEVIVIQKKSTPTNENEPSSVSNSIIKTSTVGGNGDGNEDDYKWFNENEELAVGDVLGLEESENIIQATSKIDPHTKEPIIQKIDMDVSYKGKKEPGEKTEIKTHPMELRKKREINYYKKAGSSLSVKKRKTKRKNTNKRKITKKNRKMK